MVIGLVILSHPKGGEDASWHLWCHTNLEEKTAQSAVLIIRRFKLNIIFIFANRFKNEMR